MNEDDLSRIKDKQYREQVLSEERKQQRILKRMRDLEQEAEADFNTLLQTLTELDFKYRTFGYTSITTVFETLSDILTNGRQINLTYKQHDKVQHIIRARSWLIPGLNQQKSLVQKYLRKYETVEAIHGCRLTHVDLAIKIKNYVVGNILWLKQQGDL